MCRMHFQSFIHEEFDSLIPIFIKSVLICIVLSPRSENKALEIGSTVAEFEDFFVNSVKFKEALFVSYIYCDVFQ
jgi:hypothetical protein